MNRNMRDRREGRREEVRGDIRGNGGRNRSGSGCKIECENGWKNNGWKNRRENSREHMGMYLLEAALFLACIAGMIGFFRIRRCPLDIPALILWGAVLLVLIPLLVRGEIRLHREEKQAKGIQGPPSSEIQKKQIQERMEKQK